VRNTKGNQARVSLFFFLYVHTREGGGEFKLVISAS
jgi:hypothetical protein